MTPTLRNEEYIRFHGLVLRKVKELKPGGMSDILLVEEILSKGKFALKTPKIKEPEGVNTTKFITYDAFNKDRNYSKFRSEVISYILLIHPNIVDFYGFEIVRGIPRILMRYVDGGTIDRWINEKKITNLDIVLEILIQISMGLKFSHEKDLIHRDLKPANIFIEENQGNDKFIVKISDFGLVKLPLEDNDLDTPETQSDNNNNKVNAININELFHDPNNKDKRLSFSSGFVGTPGYASPEQIGQIKEKIDKNADIFAFGIVACEILSGGKIPKFYEWIKRNGIVHIIPKILIDDVPIYVKKFLEENNSFCPKELFDIIIKCLEIEPADRWKEEKINGSFAYFDTILKKLHAVYSQVTGNSYVTPQDADYIINSDLRYHVRAKSLEKLKAPEILTNEFYDKLSKFKPNNFTEWSNKGRFLSDIKRYDEALECYSKSIEMNDKFVLSWYNKANTLVDLKRHDEALVCYDKAIEIDPNYSLSFYYKAIALEEMRRYDEALVCYDKAIEVDKFDFISINSKGNLLSSLERYDEALDCYNKAMEIEKNYAFTWFNRAQTLDDLGRKEESLDDYDKAIKIDRNDVEHFHCKGTVLEDLGRYDEALVCYNEAIKIACSFLLSHNNKGNVLKKLGRLNEAIECFDEVIRLDEKFYSAWFNKGNTLKAKADIEKIQDLQIEYYNQAEACYLNAVKDISPITVAAYYNLAVVEMKKSIKLNSSVYKEQIFEALRNAASLNPQFKNRAKGDTVFESIRKEEEFLDILK